MQDVESKTKKLHKMYEQAESKVFRDVIWMLISLIIIAGSEAVYLILEAAQSVLNKEEPQIDPYIFMSLFVFGLAPLFASTLSAGTHLYQALRYQTELHKESTDSDETPPHIITLSRDNYTIK